MKSPEILENSSARTEVPVALTPSIFFAWAPPPWVLYLLAVTFTLSVLALRIALASWMGDRLILSLFLFPIILSAYLGGLKPGLLATGVAIISLPAFFLAKPSSFALASPVEFAQWLVLLILGVLVSWLIESLHQMRRRAELNEQLQLVTLASIGDAVIATDVQGCVTFLNAAAERLTGWTFREARGQSLTAVCPLIQALTRLPLPNLPAALLNAATPSPAKLAPETVLLGRHGQEFPIEGSCASIQPADGKQTDGKHQGVVLVFRDNSEGKRAETALREQVSLQEQLSKIVSTAPGVICSYRLQPDGTVCFPFASPSIENIYGVKPEQLTADASFTFDLMHSADAAFVHTSIEESARTMKPWRAEFRVLNPTKGEIWVEGYSVPQAEADGSILWYGFITDVTARKQVEVALQERKLFDQAVLNSLNASIAVLEQDGTVMAINETWQRFATATDESAGDLARLTVGANYFEVYESAPAEPSAQADARPMTEGLRAVLSGQIPSFQHEYVCGTPQAPYWFLLSITPLLRPTGGAVVAHLDITQRKQTEDALKRNQVVLAQAERLARLGTWSVEFANFEASADYPLSWSDEVYRIVGYEPGEVVPSHELFIEHVHRDDRARVREAIVQAVAEKRHYQLEHRILRADGEERIVQEYAEITLDSHGQSLRMFGTIQDITELRRAEAQVRSSNERLKLALNAARLGVWEWDSQTDELFWSRECFEVFGVGKFGGTRASFTEFIHPEDVARTMSEFDQAIAERNLSKLEFRIIRPDGQIRWVTNVGQGTYDRTGVLLRVVGTVQDITERKRSDESLRESQRSFQQLAESLPQLVWTCDPQGMNTYSSPQWEAYTGQPAARQLGLNWLDQVHTDDQEGLKQAWLNAVAQETSHRFEFRIRRHDGCYRWFDARAVPLRDGHGQLVKWIGTNTDIQEQREMREALRISEERLRLATEAAEIGTWDRDLKGNVLIWSPTLERMMGFVPGGFPGTYEAFLEILHPDDLELMLAAQQRARTERGQYQAELRFRLPNGGERWGMIKGQVFFDQAGQPERMVGIDMDITERKRNEAEISRLAAIVESSDDAIVSNNFAGTITSWNKGAERMFGYSAAEMLGKNITVLYPPHCDSAESQQFEAEYLARIKQGEQVVRHETIRVRKDGSPFPISLTISPVLNRQGAVIGISKIGRDITERKRAEAELRLWADAFENCAHGIAIGNPLTNEIQVCNLAYARLRAGSTEEVIGAPVLAMYDPAEHTLVRQILATADAGGQAHGEVHLLRQDGSLLPVQLDIVSVRDEAGQLRYRVATLQDLTERLQAEASVRQSEERLRLLYQIIANYDLAYTERIVQLLELGTQQFGLENGVVGQVAGRQYCVTHAVSLDGSMAAGFSCRLDEALCEEVMRRNELLALEHVSHSPWREHLACATFGTEVYFGTPMQVGQRVYGTLCFASQTPRSIPFTNSDCEFLRLIAQWIGAELTRHEAEEALRRSEERQRLALESGRMGTWCWYPQQELVETDDNTRRLFGFAPDAFMVPVAQVFGMIHPADTAAVQTQLWEALEQRSTYHTEFRILHPDQSVHWITGIGRGFYREDGEFLGFNGVTFEITERKQAEEQLRQSESHFRALFEANGVGNVECDALSGRFIHVNQKMCELVGYTLDELRELTFSDITNKEDLASTWLDYQRYIWGDAPVYAVEKRYIRKDGSLVWVGIASTLLRDDQGMPWRTVAVVQDISERKQAEAELRESESRYHLLFEQPTVGVRIIDYETLQVVDCNGFAAEMLGYTRAEFLTLTVSDFEAIYSLDEIKANCEISASGGKLQFETLYRTKTGELKNVIVSGGLKSGHIL